MTTLEDGEYSMYRWRKWETALMIFAAIIACYSFFKFDDCSIFDALVIVCAYPGIRIVAMNASVRDKAKKTDIK